MSLQALLLSQYETILCIVLAIVDLFVAVPMLFLLMLKKFQFVHKQVSSDVPGNPMAFHESVISAFRTLPEPSNFNIVWTGLPLATGPLVMKGKIPGARCNSFNIYGTGAHDPPATIDAALVPIAKDGTFTLIITQDDVITTKKKLQNHPEYGGSRASDIGYLVSNKAWKMGFFAMRNYCVYPGTTVHSPEIRRVADNSVIRASEHLVAGPASLVSHYSPLCRTVVRMSVLHAIVFIVFHYLESVISVLNLDECVDVSGTLRQMMDGLVTAATVLISLQLPMERLLYISLCSLLLAYSILQLLYNSGRKGLAGMILPLCNQTYNKFLHSSIEQGAEVSQPSQLHQYWICPYLLKNNEALRISANINPRFQKYWSVVVYDEYGICLPQYVYDHLYLANTSTCTSTKIAAAAAAVAGNGKVGKEVSPETTVGVGKCVSGRWDDGWLGDTTTGVDRTAPYQANILLTNTTVRSKVLAAERDGLIVTESGGDVVSIDVTDTRSGFLSSTCKGYILFRLVHPSTNPDTAPADIHGKRRAVPLQDIIDFSSPLTSVVQL